MKESRGESGRMSLVCSGLMSLNIRSYGDDACCSSDTLMCCHTGMHAADTEHETPSHHSIQTWCLPVVLSTDVEHHTDIQNYPF